MSDTKKNVFTAMVKYFMDVKSEMKKVIWPTLKQSVNNTTIVVVSIIIIGFLIGALDLVFSYGRDNLLQLNQGGSGAVGGFLGL